MKRSADNDIGHKSNTKKRIKDKCPILENAEVSDNLSEISFDISEILDKIDSSYDSFDDFDVLNNNIESESICDTDGEQGACSGHTGTK